MKKTVSFVVLAALFTLAGCATTGTADTAVSTTNASAANTSITLEQALQKAEQTRQQLEQAKTAYQNAKSAAKASKENGTNFETELAKQVVQTKIDNTKKQINAEVEEWKTLLAD